LQIIEPIFTATRKIHAWEENHSSEMAVVMGTLLQQKRKIESLEAECQALCHQVANLTISPQPASSNYQMSIGSEEDENEEKYVLQMPGEVDEMYQDLQPFPPEQEEENSRNVLD
jgi:hypothetical protein